MMSIPFLILLSAIVVGGTLISYPVIWVRRKSSEGVRNDAIIARTAPFLIPQTARLTLRTSPLPSRAEVGQVRAAQLSDMGRLWAKMAAKGVKRLGTLKSKDGRRYIVGQHPGNNLVALVTCMEGMPPFVEFMVLSATNTAMVVSGDPAARALQLASLTVIPMRSPTYTPAVKTMAAMLPGRALDMRMLMLLIERLHATRMDSQLVRAPTLEDMNAHAALRDIAAPLNEDEQQLALGMNRQAWLDALRVALLDNGRRKLQLDEEPWGRLEDDLIVVHEGMNADEVIATLSSHELVESLGEKLKLKNIGPARIFDEINRRLDQDDRRHLVLALASPVQARLFARASELQAAGVEAQATPA
jgi:hypothetical protein